MEAGTREAIGILLPFAAHQLYRWLQLKAQRTAPHGSGELAVEADDETGYLEDEEEPEVEFRATDPICPVVEGSATQQYIRQLSYSDDGWIWVNVGVLALGPAFFWKVLLFCARCCLRPLQTPRRNVAFVAPRARRPSLGAGPRLR